LIAKFTKPKVDFLIEENIETDIFLSHKQSSGQGIAHSLYISLREKYKKNIFLDVRTEFELHDLKKLVSKTKLFVFIMTPGILESYFCFEEFETAMKLNKPMLVIHGNDFKSPTSIEDTKWKPYEKVLLGHKTLTYNAHYHEKAVEKILKKLSKASK